MIKANVFTQVLSHLMKSSNIRTEWIDSLPDTISQSFFDNEYVSSLHEDSQELLRLAFGESLADWVLWYIYDRPPAASVWGREGNEYLISNIEDFVVFLIMQGEIEQ